MLSFLKKLPLFEVAALIIPMLVLVKVIPPKAEFSMSTATALTLMLCAVCKILFECSISRKKFLLPSRILSLGIIAIGCGVFLAIVSRLISADNLTESYPQDPTGGVKEMALITAFSFILLGIALNRITINPGRTFLPHMLSLVLLFIELLSVLAYYLQQNALSKIVFTQPISISSSMCFSLLAFSILLVNRRAGFIGDLTSEHQGSKIARVLIPIAIVVPILLGFFQLRSEQIGFSSQPYEVALITLARIIILVLFIWRIAAIINRSHKALVIEIGERKKTEEALRYRKAVLEAQNEAIPDAILLVDTCGEILSYNNNFGKLWGIPQNIIDEKKYAEVLKFVMTKLVDPEGFTRRVNEIYAHPDEPAHDEILFKDGRIIERYGNAVAGDDGTKYGWAWYFKDVTLNKNYENKIKNFSRELEVKVKERTEELNKSEKRFRSLIENAQDIISLSDEKGIRFYMSPGIERLTGYSVAESINQPVFNLIHPDDIEISKKTRDELIREPGVAKPITFRFLHKTRGAVWIEGTLINLLHDENVKAVVGNFHDITERKIAEESLSKSEKRFRSLIENSHDLISLSDGKANLFYVSPSIERLTGHTIEETINRSVFSFVHPDDFRLGEIARQEFLKHPGVSIPLSFRYLHKNGNYIWMEGTLVNLLNDQNVKAVVGNYHDVTERKTNEEKIRISNERFEMVSKATNDAVWDWNLESDEIYWNEEIRSMFDYSPGDIATGSEWKVHIHPEDFKRVTKKLVYHIKNGIQGWQDEYRFRCADDTYKYVFNRGFILFNTNKKPYRIIGAMQDVTEINQLQQSLNNERIKKQKELNNATILGQEKERTEIGRELHDNINQLLTATRLYLDVAATQPGMRDEMINRSAHNVSQCMEEIRRLSNALVPPSIGLNSFYDIVQDLVDPIKLATAINITVEVNGLDKNILSGDQQLNVYRIIQEHLNNILKHSKAENVMISVTHADGQINIHIRDDGEGFDVQLRRKGIGFNNIQSRAELLNGKMEVRSKPGKGCLLVVNFPINNQMSYK